MRKLELDGYCETLLNEVKEKLVGLGLDGLDGYGYSLAYVGDLIVRRNPFLKMGLSQGIDSLNLKINFKLNITIIIIKLNINKLLAYC